MKKFTFAIARVLTVSLRSVNDLIMALIFVVFSEPDVLSSESLSSLLRDNVI